MVDARCVVPRVGRCAHSVKKDALRRRIQHIEMPFVHKPLVEGHAQPVEGVAERGKPVVVFVKNRDVHGSARGWSKGAGSGIGKSWGTRAANTSARESDRAKIGNHTQKSPRGSNREGTGNASTKQRGRQTGGYGQRGRRRQQHM